MTEDCDIDAMIDAAAGCVHGGDRERRLALLLLQAAAELDRLRADNNRLRAEVAGWRADHRRDNY